jgi:preprotein translocase subunit SecA
LRAYGQRDPLIEYKAEAFKVFEELMTNIKTEICHNIFRSASSMMAFDKFRSSLPPTTTHQAPGAFGGAAPPAAPAADGKKASDVVKQASEAMSKAKPVRSGPKVGRNDPCPCGSGKKYKQCCGKNG